jgi:CheY-like chemotaxis protein
MTDQVAKTILVAEDDHLNMRYLRNLLENNGWHVESAFNGVQAIEKLRNCKIDLILMDGSMPVMNGFEATKLIRQNEQKAASRIPIIALTGYASEEDKQNILLAGMDDYLIKPIDENVLMELIQKHFSRLQVNSPL